MIDFSALCARLGVAVPPQDPPGASADAAIEEAERAALAEYDGGMPRAWADGFARLHYTRCPPSIEARRWSRMVDDAGRFLDQWGGRLAALGWSEHDVFGHPPGRIGLVWLLDGRDVVAAAAQAATVQKRGGEGRQVYQRSRSNTSSLWQ